ncbi:hypothetical protein L249_8945 [Ophiocordyceps polyrhachis-furcata BCC 54312]|uniref:Uncharacterized protein n=1 Tax=Ophiocordyceps polyrhachis-furcata BCC 54312 TaxID=1330021 RepID=A0A367L1N2_9HYPO|nr:hypothetical protein L249_8945 [Ophiocordyceps polyrhachis-furcata BCC 54312]
MERMNKMLVLLEAHDSHPQGITIEIMTASHTPCMTVRGGREAERSHPEMVLSLLFLVFIWHDRLGGWPRIAYATYRGAVVVVPFSPPSSRDDGQVRCRWDGTALSGGTRGQMADLDVVNSLFDRVTILES